MVSNLKIKDIFLDDRQTGASLISILVASAIVGVMGIIIAQGFKSNLDVSQQIRARSSLEDLRHYIRVGMDCAQTTAVAPSSCSGTKEVELLRSVSGADPLIQKKKSNRYTTLGQYSLKAYCVDNPKIYNVDYLGPTDKDWKTLFKIPIVCP